MRWLVLLLLVLPAASGAFLDDPPDDVELVVEGQSAGTVPGVIKESVDLLALDIEETPTSILFHVTLAARAAPGDEPIKDWGLQVWFQHDEAQYAILFSEMTSGSGFGRLYHFDAAGAARYIEGVQTDWKDDTITFEVPRSAVPTRDGAPPSPLSRLHAIRIVSVAPDLVGQVIGVFPSFVTGESRAAVLRDEAQTDDAYAIQMGLPQTGTGRLASTQPFRVSNGEASTFVYWVNASRTAAGSGTYTLQARDVPTGWGVEVPAGRLELDKRPLAFPVVLHTSFAHVHGSMESFVLELQDADGSGAARLQMGILYPQVPQPAGHHNTLHLRSQAGGNVFSTTMQPANEALFGNGGHEVAYMNAAEEDAEDLGAPVDWYRCGGVGATLLRCLEVPLRPTLQMGLDFRTLETGTLAIEVDSPVPLMSAVAQGQLVHYRLREEEVAPGFVVTQGEETVLAHLAPTAPFDLSAGGSRLLEWEFQPTREADLVPYHRSAALVLELQMEYTSVPDPPLIYLGTEPNPRLLPGGVMVLPLNEYKDSLADLPSLGSDLRWSVNTTERLANPGDTILFQAKLTNQGPADTFAVRLVGHNREWASDPSGEFRLARNASKEFAVVVRVPAGAAVQSSADLVLEASSTTDITRRALVQVRTIVTDEPVPDDARLVDGLSTPDKRSPGGALLWLVPLAAWIGRSGRRGRSD